MCDVRDYMRFIEAIARLSKCIKQGHDIVYCLFFSGIKLHDDQW